MRVVFTYRNVGESGVCIGCGHPTPAKAELKGDSFRLSLFAHSACLAAIAMPFWWLHEAPVKAAMEAREAAKGFGEFHYESGYNLDFALNGKPGTSGR